MKAIPVFRPGASTDTWARIDTPFAHIEIANDSPANALAFSFDGITVHGVLYNETIFLQDVNQDIIWIKSYNFGMSAPYRVWAYGDKKIKYGNNSNQLNDNNALNPDFYPYSFPKTILGA